MGWSRRLLPCFLAVFGFDGCSCDGGPPIDACRFSDTVNGYYVVGTQEHLERLRGCRVLDGSLMVHGMVSSLEPLSSLEIVENGDLTIGGDGEGLEHLDSLAGLDALVSAQDLWIAYYEMSDSNPLPALRDVPGEFRLQTGPSFSGTFSSLEHIGTLIIDGDSLPNTLSPFPQLVSLETLVVEWLDEPFSLDGIPDDLEIHSINLNHNSEGADLAALCDGEHGVRRLAIESQPVSLDGLSCLSDLEFLSLRQTTGLESLEGLESLTTVGRFELAGNSGLVSFRGPPLSSVGELQLSGVAAVTDLGNLSSLTTLEELEITTSLPGNSLVGMAALSSVDRLTVSQVRWPSSSPQELDFPPQLSSVGELRITSNATLSSFSAPPSNLRVTEDLVITHNGQLPQAAIDTLLASISVEGRVKIGANLESPTLDDCPFEDDGECDVPDICQSGDEDDCRRFGR